MMLQMFVNGSKSIASERAKANEELKGDPIMRSDSAQAFKVKSLDVDVPKSSKGKNVKFAKPQPKPAANDKVVTRKILPQTAEEMNQAELKNLLGHLEEFKARTQATQDCIQS